jgi:hypothetical protein
MGRWKVRFEPLVEQASPYINRGPFELKSAVLVACHFAQPGGALVPALPGDESPAPGLAGARS